jgi:hypothetical protein
MPATSADAVAHFRELWQRLGVRITAKKVDTTPRGETPNAYPLLQWSRRKKRPTTPKGDQMLRSRMIHLEITFGEFT